MSTKKPIGLVVVVKDEVHDIAGWLAWHVALGFDTIFVVDDGSTDGTDWIVKAAAKSYDIRYSESARTHSYFYDRQQNEYKKKFIELKGIFSWLCFLDADEYLLLRTDATISAFLARFPDAAGIGLNWCLHGHNGHVLRPLVPAPAAYPKRSSATNDINRHVKSIVRPDRLGPRWANVHWFDIELDSYVDAAGNPIRWSSHPGIIEGTPSLDIACVMHFQNRSMEHFVDRAGKRPEISVDTRNWSREDWQAEEDEAPPASLVPMFAVLAQIELDASIALVTEMRRQLREPNFRIGDNSVAGVPNALHQPSVSVHQIKTHFGTLLQLDPASNFIIHGEAASSDLLPLFLVGLTTLRSNALLVTTAVDGRPLRLIGGREASTTIRLNVEMIADAQVTLQLPETSMFLTAEPTKLGSSAQRLVANRRGAQEWEIFSIIEAATTNLDPSVLAMAEAYLSIVARPIDPTRLETWLSAYDPSITAPLLQTVLRQLGKTDRLRLAARLSGIVSTELLAGSYYS